MSWFLLVSLAVCSTGVRERNVRVSGSGAASYKVRRQCPQHRSSHKLAAHPALTPPQRLSQVSSLQPRLFFPSSVALCDSSPGFISVRQPLQPTFLLSPVYSGRAHCKFLTEPFPKIQIYLLLLTVVRSAVPKSLRDGALGAKRSDKLACSACQVQLAENSLDLFIN